MTKDAVVPQIRAFLNASGWHNAQVQPLAGDASFRRYFRIRRDNGATAMLMDAPPPQEDPQPFLTACDYLAGHGFRAPRVLATDVAAGLALLEDFGDRRMRDHLDENLDEEEAIYREAVGVLARLHQTPAGPFDAYDLNEYLREAKLFAEWFCVSQGLSVDDAGFEAAWRAVLAPVLEGSSRVTVLRDYHAENIMLLDDGGQGLLDFQDALIGHPAYDLVSLLQDARRDVPVPLEQAMLSNYETLVGAGEDFRADYARLGAQRNAKIIGIFTRLSLRDGKHRYLDLVPRVWAALERDLRHPALDPVARWFDANIPAHLRMAAGPA
ncbi:phosphotransferase [Croceicoccus sp. F390]|uniref:Phosphotransferase n=2 Tax=Croceicoccus esteveae TaxID=3075597 RepID=A0ABU2ZEN7_9SPHN|nr:phosphotransferase [Croceicoccus sp. F390]MDT0575063.1 phosphotransferase [Croceicoccus sp. F390]